ncbi:hypothetical protein [Roseibium sp. M-1]
MFSLRPAYPRGIYVFGAVAFAFLLLAAAIRPEAGQVEADRKPASASSPQLLAMDLAQ